MLDKPKNKVSVNKLEIIHTIPKMTDTDREKNKKMIGNDLYELFLKIQSQVLKSKRL